MIVKYDAASMFFILYN